MKDIETLREQKALEKGKRIRASGGGRKPISDHDSTLRQDIEMLVEPTTRGDPESPLRWTCKSTRQLAATLQAQGHTMGRQKVADLGYSLQANRKTREGADNPNRDAQFNYLMNRLLPFYWAISPLS